MCGMADSFVYIETKLVNDSVLEDFNIDKRVFKEIKKWDDLMSLNLMISYLHWHDNYNSDI